MWLCIIIRVYEKRGMKMFVVSYYNGDDVDIDGYVESFEEGKEYIDDEVEGLFEGDVRVEWKEDELCGDEWIGSVFEGEYERMEYYLIKKVGRLSI